MRAFPLVSIIALLAFAAGTVKAEDISLCEKAKEAARSGDHNKAVGRFNGCIQLGKLRTEALADAYFERGKSLLQLGRLNSALTDFNQTVGMRYKLDESYFHRALIFAQAYKHELAIVEYGRAILIKPEDPKLYYITAPSPTWRLTIIKKRSPISTGSRSWIRTISARSTTTGESFLRTYSCTTRRRSHSTNRSIAGGTWRSAT